MPTKKSLIVINFFIQFRYKQTELGVIPQDWRVCTVADICDLIVDCKNRTAPVVESSDYAVVRTPNVRNGLFVRENLRFTDEESFQEWTARTTPKVGDVLITREAPLGEVCLVPSDMKVCLGQRMMLYRPNQESLSSRFLLYILMSSIVQRNLHKKIGGSTVGHAKVDDIRNLEIILPSTLTEQTLIANALSDTDALIQSRTCLIAKKRRIKQGAMQTLLNPYENDRLKEGWEMKKLGGIADVKDGTHQTPKYANSGIPFYSVENVTRNDFVNTKFISEDEHKLLTKSFKMEKGDLLMTRIGSIGDCKIIDWDVDASFYVSLALLKFKTGCSAAYLLHYSKTHAFKKEIELNSLQFAIPKKINLGQILNVGIALPDDSSVQLEICQTLSDMDSEIAALESKLSKTRQIKQGMMQNLLTGRIRLI